MSTQIVSQLQHFSYVHMSFRKEMDIRELHILSHISEKPRVFHDKSAGICKPGFFHILYMSLSYRKVF